MAHIWKFGGKLFYQDARLTSMSCVSEYRLTREKLSSELKLLFATMHINQPCSYSRNSKINSFPFLFLTVFQIFQTFPIKFPLSDHRETAPNMQKKLGKKGQGIQTTSSISC